MQTRVLVVDDEPDVLLLVSANVRAWGCEVLTADNVSDGFRLCREERPDVLLLDVSLPGTDGPTFLGQLRAEGLAPEFVFFVSAIPPDQLETVASDHGVLHVSKPFTSSSLRSQLSAAIPEVQAT